MARINRRAVVAGVGASALAGPVAAALPPIAPGRTKVVFISDVHIGDNSPTVWYQKDFHEPFLVALLDHVIAQADQVRELIILGDFIDYWTYPPNRRPPGFREIAAANPAIFGPRAKLAQVLSALKGRVTYIPGNHDMGVTQRDVDFRLNCVERTAVREPGGSCPLERVDADFLLPVLRHAGAAEADRRAVARVRLDRRSARPARGGREDFGARIHDR